MNHSTTYIDVPHAGMEQILIGQTFGALLVGDLFSAVLYGVVCLQVLTYLTRFLRDDKRYIVIVVLTLWSLETAHFILLENYIYRCLIVQYGNPLALSITTKANDVTIGVIAMITFIVHCFLTWRIWTLSRNNIWLTGIIGLLALLHFALEITVMAFSIKYARYDQFYHFTPWYASALALGAILDIAIAGSVAYFLKTHQNGIKRTDNMINIIVAYAIGSGALTSAADIVILGFFVSSPGISFIFLAIYMCIPHFYAISLLTTLNARTSLRKMNLQSISIGSRNNGRSHQRSTEDSHITAGGLVFRVTESGTDDDIQESRSIGDIGKHP